MPENTQIFKATYSGVPVYEMMCKGVAVMRRRVDGWLNATQILKVAGFDKPQRTRILEREVQKGEHEKVQGGYGKYQGTWIPIERGLELARQYSCEHLLQAIIDFQPAAKSPPLAPKHLLATPIVTNSTANAAKPISRASTQASVAPPGPSTRSRRPASSEDNASEIVSARAASEESMTPSPSASSSSSRTPSPIASPPPYVRGSLQVANTPEHELSQSRRRTLERYPSESMMSDSGPPAYGEPIPSSYGEQLLEYFISDRSQVPSFLINPPRDFDPNVTIDDDGHTALHWAAAMGRVRIVKLLMTAGADMFRINKSGQTPLMRSVMFANNYDVRKFPELYELLHRSTLNIDHHNRTVFHHVVDVAMSKGKSHAARYYMETILARLADYPTELRDVINFQDEDGETALTLAARCRSKRLVKQLIDVGASVKIKNHDGKSAEDYILEDERFRESPTTAPRLPRIDGGPAPPPTGPPGWSDTYFKSPFSYSAAAQKASSRVLGEMSVLLDGLANSFDTELRAKERDQSQAYALLSTIQAEILESQRGVSALRNRGTDLPNLQAAARQRADALRSKMIIGNRVGLERWLAEEEAREHEIRLFGPKEVVADHLAAEARALGSESPFPAPGAPTNGATVPIGASAHSSLSQAPTLASLTSGLFMDGVAYSATLPASAPYTPATASLSAKGKRKITSEDEQTEDLRELYSDIPLDPETLRAKCEELRQELSGHRKRRKVAIETTVKVKTEVSTSERMNSYRKLIGAACGGVPQAEVDAFLGMLLEALEQEESASATSVAWSGVTVMAGSRS